MKKKILSLVISLSILAVIYYRLDIEAIWEVLSRSDADYFNLALLMFIPTTLLSSWRFSFLAPGHSVPLGLSLRLNLAGGSLNLVLPSKMGDLLKVLFIRKKVDLSDGVLLSLAVLEKSLDMAALMLWCILGVILHPTSDILVIILFLLNIMGLVILGLIIFSASASNQLFKLLGLALPGKLGDKAVKLGLSWSEMQNYFRSIPHGRLVAVAASLAVWFLHLLQIWLFMLALRLDVGFAVNMALTPLAIFVGLMPMTLAGIGTRDAALIYFYLPYFSAASAAALGLLCTLRYLIPALLGVPFVFNFTQNAYLKKELEQYGKGLKHG